MCSCQKRNLNGLLQTAPVVSMSMPANAVETWGPIMWKMMHVAATKIGQRSPLDDDITSYSLPRLSKSRKRLYPGEPV
jgi:hypothetical protein